MILEQTAEATRRYRQAHPLSWARIWPAARLLIPLVVFILLSLAEIPIFKNLTRWIEGEATHSLSTVFWEVTVAWLTCGVFPVAVLLTVHWKSRLSVELNEQGLHFRNRKGPRHPWSQLESVLIEPMPEDSGLGRATFYSRLSPRQKLLFRPWQILLEIPSQRDALLQELEKLHPKHPTFSVRVLQNAADPVPPTTRSMRWIAAFVLGIWLLLHGLPLTVVGLNLSPAEIRPSSAANPPSQAFAEFLLEHFTSVKAFRRFLWTTGATLSAAGLIAFMIGSYGMNRQDAEGDRRSYEQYQHALAAPGTTILSKDAISLQNPINAGREPTG